MAFLDLSARPKPHSHMFILTAASLALLLVFLCASLVDTRLVDGVNPWMKPMKFTLSFAVLCGTLALVENRLSQAWKAGWIVKIAFYILAIAMISEMAYIGLQAGKGEASHFNLSTPFHTFMYTVVMFSGAVAIVLIVGLYGLIAFFDKAANLSHHLRLGVSAGFVLSCILTIIVAGTMGGNGSHHVGVPSAENLSIPFLGWSLEVGDLRPAHFLSLHAMQILPLAGWYMDRKDLGAKIWPMAVIASTYSLVTLALFAQARAGLPLF